MTSDTEALLLFVLTCILLPEHIQMILYELVCNYHQIRPKFGHKKICSIIASHYRVAITYSFFQVNFQKRRDKLEKHVTGRELRNIMRNKLNTLSLVGYRKMTKCIKVCTKTCIEKYIEI